MVIATKSHQQSRPSRTSGPESTVARVAGSHIRQRLCLAVVQLSLAYSLKSSETDFVAIADITWQ